MSLKTLTSMFHFRATSPGAHLLALVLKRRRQSVRVDPLGQLDEVNRVEGRHGRPPNEQRLDQAGHRDEPGDNDNVARPFHPWRAFRAGAGPQHGVPAVERSGQEGTPMWRRRQSDLGEEDRASNRPPAMKI